MFVMITAIGVRLGLSLSLTLMAGATSKLGWSFYQMHASQQGVWSCRAKQDLMGFWRTGGTKLTAHLQTDFLTNRDPVRSYAHNWKLSYDLTRAL